MSSGCHCFALRLLTLDQDSQPAIMDAARSMSSAVVAAVRPLPIWISNCAMKAVATVARPKLAGQSLGLRRKTPDTIDPRAMIAKTPAMMGVLRLNEARRPSQAPEPMKRILVMLRMLYLDGEITAADSGGVNENGFPRAWFALVVPRCFLPVRLPPGPWT